MRRLAPISVLLLLAITAAPASGRHESPRAGYPPAKKMPLALLQRQRVQAHRAASRPATPVGTDNFEVVGHTDLGGLDTNGDVWAHGDFAYVGTWRGPCNGRGVKIVDVSDPTAPRLIGTLAARPGTSAEDVVVRHVSSPAFSGDLLAVGIQRCGTQVALDEEQFGLELWDVTDPKDPRRLSVLGVANGSGGVHELDLVQRGSDVFALLATPNTEWFDPVPGGDFRIVDATNPSRPVQIGQWGAGEQGLTRGPWSGIGATGLSFGHSVRASLDGTKAYVSYWDLGILTLDITDVTDPTLVSRTTFPANADGDGHSATEYQGATTRFLLQQDEDFDPRSPAHIVTGGESSTAGLASESPSAPPLWSEPGHEITARVVRPSRQGCGKNDYPRRTERAIAVVRTPFHRFDPEGGPPPLCSQRRQEAAASAAGAAAVVHDFISTATSPQWWTAGTVRIPVLFTDHATAREMTAAGSATLRAGRPSWGFLRVFEAATGAQVATFDDVPNVHKLRSPLGTWTVHNTEVMGGRAYTSWYSNGLVALDLSPLDESPPSDPVLVGRFVPVGAPSQSGFIPGNVPAVWGVAVRHSDGLVFVSDMNSGLWIVRPTGPAAP